MPPLYSQVSGLFGQTLNDLVVLVTPQPTELSTPLCCCAVHCPVLLLMSLHIPSGLITGLENPVTQSNLPDHCWFLCFSPFPFYSFCVSLIYLSI